MTLAGEVILPVGIDYRECWGQRLIGLVVIGFFLYQLTGSALVHARSQRLLLQEFKEKAPLQAADPADQVSEDPSADGLLSPDEVRLRTSYPDNFQISDITDLERKSFYHGVHFQAVGREESWDLAFRVWKVPPGGLDPVIATIKETMGPVTPTSEITPETWVLATAEVQAVARKYFSDDGVTVARLDPLPVDPEARARAAAAAPHRH